MGLQFFADQCVPTVVVEDLRDAGYEVWYLRDHLPIESSDVVVISKTQELWAILISLNGDFSNIFNYPPADYQGIISLQVRNHPEVLPQIVSRLKDYLSANPDMEHYKGKLFLVEAHRIRIRQ
jgi:predicted nuclease of predicted toxin-antitoxin system